ncbi:F-box/RNI-like superfamily protein [Striga asiatica]|uniref:F-box/RNI-like superfamily protein n=1 Tax=Striga asiatica TaxID=4170 RepID=A0A5A7Q6I8_STRAF|nr:F-box/RNI-like superfamily protein [Striga asiatica]
MPMKKKKQAAETADTVSTVMDDRISQLPIPILHHILCSLSQIQAVRTCVLSKQWRYIGLTRPNLEFYQGWFNYYKTQRNLVSESSEKLFNTTQQNFVSVLNRILQGYIDQNLPIHKLRLHIWNPGAQLLISFLDQWIADCNIKVFKLSLSFTYDQPWAFFFSESLEELHLRECKLSPVESVRFKSLRTLTLERVQVDCGTFETKTLGCPLLTRLVLNNCLELRNVRLSEAPGLKHFELFDYERREGGSIEIDVPNLETVRIRGPWIWSDLESTFMFSRLTSLHLCNVILSSESIDLLPFGCPTLESLALDNCSGFEEFHFASDSVKRLTISTTEILLKGVTICAPNILNFMIIAPQVLDTFSITATTSKEWDSNVILNLCDDDDPDNSWFLNLRRMLKPLSGSRIDLILQMYRQDVQCGAVDGSRVLSDEPPLVVENLEFRNCKCHTESWYSDFTNDLFRVCRPRHVWGHRLLCLSEEARHQSLSKFQFNMLLANMSLGTFWRHDVEQVHVKIVNGKKWQLVQWTDLSELQNRECHGVPCVKLKWSQVRFEAYAYLVCCDSVMKSGQVRSSV